MARINLLPWREQRREESKQRFLASLVGTVIVGCGVIFFSSQYFERSIAQQQARNEYIRSEIVVLDKRIAEISALKEQRAQLLERMKVIQDLQGNRSVTARIFDQLVRAIPDGVHFKHLKLTGVLLAIQGEAESNNRVSSLMRNLDASEWFTAPNLTAVKAISRGGVEQANTFELSVSQTQPETSAEGAEK